LLLVTNKTEFGVGLYLRVTKVLENRVHSCVVVWGYHSFEKNRIHCSVV